MGGGGKTLDGVGWVEDAATCLGRLVPSLSFAPLFPLNPKWLAIFPMPSHLQLSLPHFLLFLSKVSFSLSFLLFLFKAFSLCSAPEVLSLPAKTVFCQLGTPPLQDAISFAFFPTTLDRTEESERHYWCSSSLTRLLHLTRLICICSAAILNECE